MSKRPMGHGDIKRMSQFKAIAMDYAYYVTLGDEGRLYCLTDKQIYILLAQMDYVGWMTRWYNTEDITQKTLGFIQSELMEKLMDCIDISILVDQGKLNTTRNVQQQQIQSQQLRDAYAEEYTGDPTSINPDAPTANFGNIGDRYDALCAALMAFVYQFAKAQIEAIVAGDIAAFALLAGAALLLIPGLNLFFIAGASIALIAGGGIIGVSTAVACAALGDTTALDNVVCYMRTTLASQSVSEANWSACLDSYPFGVGTNEAIVCDFIKPTLAANYFTILDMLGQAYSGTINGEPLPECPCEEPAGVWRIWTELDPTYNFGEIIEQTADTILVEAGANTDGVYRVVLKADLCHLITAVSISESGVYGNRGCEEWNIVVDPLTHVEPGETIDRMELHGPVSGAPYTLEMSWS
jgi:hypothetical protein